MVKKKEDEFALNQFEDTYRKYIEGGVTCDDLKARLDNLLSHNTDKRKQYAQLDSRLKSEQKNIDSLTQYLQKRLDGLEMD